MRLRLMVGIGWLILLLGARTAYAGDAAPPLAITFRDEAGAVWSQITPSREPLQLLSAADAPPDVPVQVALAPGGAYVAVSVQPVNVETTYDLALQGLTLAETDLRNTLHIFALPEGQLALTIDLLPDDFVFGETAFTSDDGISLLDTFLRGGMVLSWSPDGSQLLFGTATPSYDGYGRLALFDAVSETVIDLEDTPGTAYDIHWSPDGQYAYFGGVDNLGTGAGVSSTGAWALGPDHKPVRLPVETMLGYDYNPSLVGDLVPIGWLSDTQFVFSDFDISVGGGGLFVYDAAANSILSLLPLVQFNVTPRASDISPATGQILVYVSHFLEGIESEFPDYAEYMLPAGLYLYPSVDAEPISVPLPEDVESLQWASFAGATHIVYRARVDREWVDYVYDTETETLSPIELAEQRTIVYGDGIISTSVDETRTLIDVATGERVPLIGDLQSELLWLDEDWFVALSGDSSTVYVGNRNNGIQETVFEGEDVTVLAVGAVR